MSAVLDLAPAPMVAAGGYSWPDDVAGGKARQARIDKQASKVPGVPARLAEEFVVAVGWDWHLPPAVTHMLKAAAAELVDNAVSHAQWPGGMHVVLVDVALHAHRVVLEVRDPDPQLPQIPEPTAGLDALVAALDDPEVSPEELEQVPHGLAYLSGLLESLAVLPEPIGKVLRATVALPDSRTCSVTAGAGDASRTGGGTVNREKVANALYDLFERVGIEFDRAQAKPLAAGLGQIITACIAAARQETPDRCSVCSCLLPVEPCGHSCCTRPGGAS